MYKIPQEKIEEVRSSINIVHYITQFINLKKEGRNFKGLCPFHHEKTPSFVVSPEKQFYHCFGCGKGGNLFSFIMDYEKLPFVDAITKAADFAGIVLPKPEQKSPEQISRTQALYDINHLTCTFFENQLHLPQNKARLEYFLGRKLSEKTIKKFRLSYAPDSFDLLLKYFKENSANLKLAEELGLIQKKQNSEEFYVKFRHRMMFPFFNIAGKIIGFGGRKLNEEQQPKYLNSPESEIYKKGLTLYGLHHAIQSIREQDFIILVEGYFDLLRLVEAGQKNVVASSGTALTDQQARLMARYSKNIYIAYDGDAAGIKAAIRNAQIIENQELNAYIVPMPEGEDPDDFVLQHGLKKFHELLKQKTLPIEFQLNNYVKLNPNPSLEEKDNFISQVLGELVSFKSASKAGLYIHHLADRMQVSEAMLVTEVNRLKQRQARFNKGRQKTDEPTDEIPEEKQSIKRGAHKAEEGLLELLLNAGADTQNYVIEHVSINLFENEDYSGLYDHIIHDIEEHGSVDVQKLFENQELNKNQHLILTRLTINPLSNEMKHAVGCIFQLKKWSLEKQERDIQQHIKMDDSEESAMHYTFELAKLNKEKQKLNKDYLEDLKTYRSDDD
ncbi:MAG: DNA primase [Calditrichaeota bacterium]|nr:MAG: DNA primase [Calditrichota bacterium]MBL1204414.1 DNA primase [Calditrichota bacterium]NOG44243.1 DNA primase [Calditrichota bacterium]